MLDIYTDIAESMRNAMEEGLQESMNLPGYSYRDISWMAEEYWDILLGIIGNDNFKILVATAQVRDGKKCFRGQFMISPEGMQNIKDYAGL